MNLLAHFKASRKRAYRYWSHDVLQVPGNQPKDYMDRDPAIVPFMIDLWRGRIPKDATIMELGCNVGRNVYYLKMQGFMHVWGIDINLAALEAGINEWPELQFCLIHADIQFMKAPVTAKTTVCLFSVAALQHVKHPPWNEIVKAPWICLVEHPNGQCRYQYQHDYERELAIRRAVIVENGPVSVAGYEGYRAILARGSCA